MELADIDRVLYDRSVWQRGYSNWSLETKRRSAILWLRYKSKRGWLVDNIIGRKKPATPAPVGTSGNSEFSGAQLSDSDAKIVSRLMGGMVGTIGDPSKDLIY